MVLHRLGRDEAELLFEVLQGARGADDVSVLVSEGEPVTDWQWRVGVLVTVPDVWSDARVDLEGDLATAARTIERPGRAGCGGRVTNQRCKGQGDGGKGCCADVFGLRAIRLSRLRWCDAVPRLAGWCPVPAFARRVPVMVRHGRGLLGLSGVAALAGRGRLPTV